MAKSRYLTVEELSRESRLSVSTLHRLKRAGKIPYYQPSGKGGRLLFPPDAIEHAVQASSSEPNSTSTDHVPQRLAGPRPAWMQRGAATE
jgi:excisionase family DNA binding protein